MFAAHNFVMEQVELAERMYLERPDDWIVFKELFMALFWDLIYFREVSILACSSEVTTEQIELHITGGVDMLANFRVVGLKAPMNMRYVCFQTFSTHMTRHYILH